MLRLDLTAEEAEVVDDYVFRKMCRLEESGLTDSKCYQAFLSVHEKIRKAKKGSLRIGQNTL